VAGTRAPGRRRGGPRRALAAFLATAFVGLALASVGTAILSGRIAQANALSDAEGIAQHLSRYLVAPVLADALAGVPGRRDELRRRVVNRLQDRSIQAVFVWTPSGEVLYCSDPALIGSVARPTPELLKAVNGAVVSDVDDSPELPFAGAIDRPLVEVYVPISAGARKLAFEVYFDSANIEQDAARLRGRILPMAVGALCVLQLVQIPVAVSLARRARRQENERAALMARTLTASDRERRAIAADVRKGAVQELTRISQGLAALRHQVPSERQGLVDRLTAAVGNATLSLRRLIVDLYPPEAHGPGLGAMVADLAGQLRESGAEVTLDLSPLPALRPETEVAIYRTAKEALTNVARHAGATRVWLRLEPVENSGAPAVRLVVADDGVGFPAAVPGQPQDGHLGLRLVADRAEDAGGVLHLSERTGGGASVTVVFPVGTPAPAPLPRTEPGGGDRSRGPHPPAYPESRT
jgi:signal transduction histidine kinase